METTEAALNSVKEFEAKRAEENYAPDSDTRLNRIAVMAGTVYSHRGSEAQAPAPTIDWSLMAGVTDHGDGKDWVGDGSWEFRVGGIVYKEATPEAAISAALSDFRDMAWPAIVEAAQKVEADVRAQYQTL